MENSPDNDQLFDELIAIQQEIDHEAELLEIAERSMVELKYLEFQPLFDEYYGSKVVNAFSVEHGIIEKKGAKRKPVLRDPKGGLTAAGRRHFKRTEGANLKPGVKGPANTPEKMRRKGSFLTRFFTNPSGPMKDDKGRATRLALSAAAWGEPVPQNAEDAARLAAKGRRLLERYGKLKKKSADAEFVTAIKSIYGEDNKGMLSYLDSVNAASDVNGITHGKSALNPASFMKNEIDGIRASRRRKAVRQQLFEYAISQKSLGHSVIPGDVDSLKRINSAISFMSEKRAAKHSI